MTVQLGKTYIDKITKFRGVAVGYVVYISGCNQVLLVPQVDKNGKRQEGEWFDEQRLDEVRQAKPIVLENAGIEGPDQMAPKR